MSRFADRAKTGAFEIEEVDSYDPAVDCRCNWCGVQFNGSDSSGGHHTGNPFPCCQSSPCCQSFSSMSGFDRHMAATGKPGHMRCLTPDEMRAKGWTVDDNKVWRLPRTQDQPVEEGDQRMSSEPADFRSSKRDRHGVNAAIFNVGARLQRLEEVLGTDFRQGLLDDIAGEDAVQNLHHMVEELQERVDDLDRRIEHHHVPGQMPLPPARVTPKQREALTYMAAHADLHLPPVVWQENGGFGGSILPKLVEHGFVDRISGNRYRINATGLDYLSGEAS